MKIMTDAKSVSISIPETMDQKLEELVENGFFSSKSECIREGLRGLFNRYQSNQYTGQQDLISIITTLWDSHDSQLATSLSKVKDKNDKLLMGNFHVHVSENYCLDVLVARGINADISQFVKDIREIKRLENVEFITIPAIFEHHNHENI